MAAWKDIGKNILKGSLVIVGTRFMTEKVVPAAAEHAKDAWDRIKNTKKTGKDPEVIEVDETPKKPTHKAAKTRVINSQTRAYDAEYDGADKDVVDLLGVK